MGWIVGYVFMIISKQTGKFPENKASDWSIWIEIVFLYGCDILGSEICGLKANKRKV